MALYGSICKSSELFKSEFIGWVNVINEHGEVD